MKNNLLTVKSHTNLTIAPVENEYSLNCLELLFGVSEKERRTVKEHEREKRKQLSKKEAFGMAVGGAVLAFLVITLIILSI